MPSDFTGDFAEFSNIERKNHPAIIKVTYSVYQLTNQRSIKKRNQLTNDFQIAAATFDYCSAITIVVCQNLIFDLYRSLALLTVRLQCFPFFFFNKSF